MVDRHEVPPAEDGEPRSASEKYLAALWAELIGLDRVTLPSKFLEVGGNSLTLNILLNRIEAEMGVELDPQLFFDDDTSSLFELARRLDDALAQRPDPSQSQ
jgi:hypothetical protein